MRGSSTKMAVIRFQGHNHKLKFHMCDDPQKQTSEPA
jgi:hypothetical protein